MPAQRGFFVQFLHLAGPFWSSENKVVIRQQTIVFISLTILQMVLAVIITEWSAALFNAIEQHSMSALLTQIGYLILIFVASLAVTAYHLKVKRRIQIAWRAWLTERVIGQWMQKEGSDAYSCHRRGWIHRVTRLQSAGTGWICAGGLRQPVDRLGRCCALWPLGARRPDGPRRP